VRLGLRRLVQGDPVEHPGGVLRAGGGVVPAALRHGAGRVRALEGVDRQRRTLSTVTVISVLVAACAAAVVTAGAAAAEAAKAGNPAPTRAAPPAAAAETRARARGGAVRESAMAAMKSHEQRRSGISPPPIRVSNILVLR